MLTYKGIFANLDEVEAANKSISIVPGKDGFVYEIRKTNIGSFVTRTAGDKLLSSISAGFTRALPLIPLSLTMEMISFFRCLAHVGSGLEALVNVYWDSDCESFLLNVPKQTISKAAIEAEVSDEFTCGRYLHYMDIHSHNTMRAFFSEKDNKDEKATRLYAVVGSLQNYFPQIKVRMSNGGKFLQINPNDVFEPINIGFPEQWMKSITLESQMLNQ